MRKRVLLFGGSGLVGEGVIRILEKEFDVTAPKHKDVNVTSFLHLSEIIDFLKPDIIINFVGMVKMEMTEEFPEKAFLLNVVPSRIINEIIQGRSIPYYYLSTDAVFCGSKKREPFDEVDPIDPKGVYSLTKAEGEKITLGSSSKNGVIRITLPYSVNRSKKDDVVRSTIKALTNGNIYDGIIDQFINPIFVEDIAIGLRSILREQSSGIYHLAARNKLSNFEFVRLIAKRFGLNENLINACNLREFQVKRKTKLANNCVLKVDRYQNEFGLLPMIEESLDKFYRYYKDKSVI